MGPSQQTFPRTKGSEQLLHVRPLHRLRKFQTGEASDYPSSKIDPRFRQGLGLLIISLSDGLSQKSGLGDLIRKMENKSPKALEIHNHCMDFISPLTNFNWIKVLVRGDLSPYPVAHHQLAIHPHLDGIITADGEQDRKSVV